MKYCENCGAELEDSAVFCDECGARVETVPQEKAVDSEQSKEAEKQENAVIDTSDKPVEKRKRMIPILCTYYCCYCYNYSDSDKQEIK